jgi:hypothetical protein
VGASGDEQAFDCGELDVVGDGDEQELHGATS